MYGRVHYTDWVHTGHDDQDWDEAVRNHKDQTAKSGLLVLSVLEQSAWRSSPD